MNDHVAVAPDVRAALERRAAIVGLETAIVSHGMPFPENVTTACALEAVVRGLGAVPATIGVLGGRVRVGLSDSEIEHFAQGRSILKLSSADLPYAVAAGKDGATTVAATILCAHLAGIRVVATGGIGGVHRDAETTLDVSADLTTLARTPMTVVCSGAKAILNIERTLELLETLGVSVVCYRTDEFPAFWSRSSGIPAPIRVDSVEEIARLIRTKRELGLSSAVIVANPVAEADEIPMRELTSHIDDATQEAHRQGITGKGVTPFLLDWIATSTGARSLATNIALVKGNVRLAALLALALAEGR